MTAPRTFQAVNPASGEKPGETFPVISPEELEQAVEAARRAEFLGAAGQITAHADELVARAREETALPEPRLRGEVAPEPP